MMVVVQPTITRIALAGLSLVLATSLPRSAHAAEEPAPAVGRADERPSKAPKQPEAVQVTVDVSEVPELKEWADKAKELVEKWHPIISDLLKSDGFTPPSKVQLVFKKDMRGVAATSGTRISIAVRWVQKHPEDYGMVVHELTHVVQSYPGNDAGWLVEGIADYVRFFHYEPETKLGPVARGKAGYRDGYRTAAAFPCMDREDARQGDRQRIEPGVRHSEYHEKLFKDYTGKSLDELWDEFLQSAKK